MRRRIAQRQSAERWARLSWPRRSTTSRGSATRERAPHAGADIPLGIQYWMGFFSGQSASAAQLLGRLDKNWWYALMTAHGLGAFHGRGAGDQQRSSH